MRRTSVSARGQLTRQPRHHLSTRRGARVEACASTCRPPVLSSALRIALTAGGPKPSPVGPIRNSTTPTSLRPTAQLGQRVPPALAAGHGRLRLGPAKRTWRGCCGLGLDCHLRLRRRRRRWQRVLGLQRRHRGRRRRRTWARAVRRPGSTLTHTPAHTPLRVNCTVSYQQSMVTASLRTDNCPQPKEARPLSHTLTSD